ncbi:hypothetical protein FcAc13_08305 [Frischella sp. Ac13]|uniref:Phage protein GP46 n=1 Tax=Frischella japonica TaxID=2741544 RepID=A0ABR7QYZ2_9GAMM|nr:hypothetical protein [Frischella japonica]MBC9131310.1 hypothetical protein [Frischella japonica]
MIVRELDINHDWTFGRGKANYLTGSAAIRQCIKTKLFSLKNNWFLNKDDGIAWFNYLEKNPDTIQLEREIKTAILSVEGVNEIIHFTILLDSITRIFLVQVTYNDKYNNLNEVEYYVDSH